MTRFLGTLLVWSILATIVGAQAPVGAQPAAVGPPVPFEDVGACPFEGCVYREWTAKASVAVRADRRANAPVAFRVAAGEKITALTGVVMTVKAGRVRFREPHDVPTSEGPIHVPRGRSLYLLTSQGEGFMKAWFNGRIYTDVDITAFLDARCNANPSRCAGTLVERSQTVWWVQLRNAAGNVGWTNEPDKFDGKDALAE